MSRALVCEMRKKHIVMAVTNDLMTDQRVDRSCCALVEAGYSVTLVGRRLSGSGPLPERGYRMQRMRLLFVRTALFYGEYNLRLFLKLLVSKADAFYANDSDTLPACCMAARLRGKPLLFDAHELFPEVPELVGRRLVKQVWQWVERVCLPHVDAAFTVCGSLAEEYRRRYGVEMAVVRNLPDWSDSSPVWRAGEKEEWTILYQGAVNVGRGVRELVDAMEYLPGCRLVVAGQGDLSEELSDYAAGLPWCGRVTFLGRVAPKVLRGMTASADLGVCLLEDLGLNYRMALPNRIADFAHAGVPILATDFCEIRRVVATYQTGTLVEACPKEKSGTAYRDYVRNLAGKMYSTLLYWNMLPQEERMRRFDNARSGLCWEKEKKVLTSGVDAIFKQHSR